MVNYNSEWYIVGGTSFAAPAWAAFIALVDENRSVSLSNVQTQLYSLAGGSRYSSDFRDITSGSNGSAPHTFAKKGYDLVTGLGTPLEGSLLSDLSGK